MELIERLKKINNLFVELERESSRNVKQYLIDNCRKLDIKLSEDLDFCFEYLTGQHKLGYKVNISNGVLVDNLFIKSHTLTLKEFLEPFYNIKDYSDSSIYNVCQLFEGLGWFLNPLLNRIWRLGINKSQLEKTQLTPMLAKKFDKTKEIVSKDGYVITEKLDGNRCIAYYSNEWCFVSRSGKPLKVNFDMSKFDVNNIYDGEILSKDQLHNPSQNNFNTLSGIINSDNGNKNELVYVIFDIIDSTKTYSNRRFELDGMLCCESNNVKILPILASFTSWNDLVTNIDTYLNKIVDSGGEGVMVNCCSATYQHKRTDQLLKYKPVYTMDMKVIGLIPGTGKNEELVGSLECVAKQDGKVFSCMVGSGLSDYQRELWSMYPDLILNKVVEVQYFSYSQDSKALGTNRYSLRFPRFKRVRNDKKEVSIY